MLKATNGEVRCSHTTIHALLAGRKLPTNGDLLFELVKFLNNRNRHRRVDEDALLDELDQLWRPATRAHLLDLPTPPGTGMTQLPPGNRPSSSDLVNSAKPPTGTADHGAVNYAAERRTYREGSASVSGPQLRSRSPVLPDLRTSQVVLAGVSRYYDTYLPDLPVVTAGTDELHRLLAEPGGVFLNENITTLHNPSTLQLFESVQRASERASDTLLVYFSGHGLVSQKGELLLATPETKADRTFTAAPYETVRDLISNSRAHRSVVILDSCFSGRALEAMGPLDGLTAIPATYVITSTSSNRAAFAPADSSYTQFTGSLIEVLREGIPGLGELLTVDDIYQQLFRRASEQEFPLPQRRMSNANGIGLALARNLAYQPQWSGPPGPDAHD
ncbi:caspase family protein [Amycolatopsis sp. NPDC048633]|uniref:caspase family protein n=1 Tax=Amycolatopsis sp. NPDC048633 TaxID=3157095 RepID=UPI00340CA3D1